MNYSDDYYRNYSLARELAEEYFYEDWGAMDPDEQRELLEKIIDADYRMVGILVEYFDDYARANALAEKHIEDFKSKCPEAQEKILNKIIAANYDMDIVLAWPWLNS